MYWMQLTPLGARSSESRYSRDGLPIPIHAGLHRLVGNRLGAGHREHRALAEIGLAGREAEAAIAEHERGHAVPSGDRAIGIPADLGVVMGVQIDEAGRDDQAVGVDGLLGEAGRASADLGDLAVFNPDVAAIARDAGAVDDGAAFDLNVIIGHLEFPPEVVRTWADRQLRVQPQQLGFDILLYHRGDERQANSTCAP